MFAVIFEVRPRQEHWNDYLELAGQLKPKLEAIDGFIENERFGGDGADGRILSLSIWRDEKSVVRWRTEGEHHAAQSKGRSLVFADYHLRVGEIIADNAPPNGVLMEERRFDATQTGDAKICSLTELTMASSMPAPEPDLTAPGLIRHASFESLTNPGKRLILASWRDEAAARTWRIGGDDGIRHRLVRVIRDYGMFDRREAPQFYPAARK